MIELYLAKKPIDVDQRMATLLTMAIDDIKDFGAKNTAQSKSIYCTGTNRNNEFFGNIFDVSVSNNYEPTLHNSGINFNAAISVEAIAFSDNIQCFKGVAQLLEVEIHNGVINYEIFLVGEFGGFIAKLGNKKLEDLDFSAYDHTYSIANITGSWSNAGGGSGYYYPLIDYGNVSAAKKDYKVGAFRPALFANEYWEKILEATEYTDEFPLRATARFKGLIVPNNFKLLQKLSSEILNISTATTLSYSSTSNIARILPFNTLTNLGLFTAISSNTEFEYNGTASIDTFITFKMNVTFSFSTIFVSGTVSLFLNVAEIFTRFYASGGTFIIDEVINNISLSTSDILFVVVTVVNPSGATSSVVINSSQLKVNTYTELPVPIYIGDSLPINEQLPRNILQKDFISSIVKLYHLYIFEDKATDKLLRIEPFVDFYADAESEDWSLKIDRSKPMVIKPMSELNSRYYDFKFKRDSDYYNDLYAKRYNEDYGTFKYDSQFEFANETKSVELIFSGTPLVGYSGEDKVVSTIFKRTGETTGSGEESIDSNIRLLQAKLITGVSSWKIRNAADNANLHTGTDFPYAGHLNDPNAPTNDIQFGVPKELFFTLVSGALNVNQFNVYWSSYMAEITDKDSKLLTATIKLNYKDIYNLDFRKLKWIDGSLFRLNKVIDFDATNENTCKVELLKIINKIY